MISYDQNQMVRRADSAGISSSNILIAEAYLVSPLAAARLDVNYDVEGSQQETHESEPTHERPVLETSFKDPFAAGCAPL